MKLALPSKPRAGRVCVTKPKSLARPQVKRSSHVVRALGQPQLPPWEIMWEYLLDQKMESVSPGDARSRAEAGEWVIVDVRPESDFEKASAEGAVNVPLFQAVNLSQATPLSLLRAVAMGVNGVKPVEPNPNFDEQLKERTAGKKAIMMCEAGGTMLPSANFMNGKTSRSLKAAYIASKRDLVPDVAHLEGGMFAWSQSQAPVRGEYTGENAGRTPNIAKEAVVADEYLNVKK